MIECTGWPDRYNMPDSVYADIVNDGVSKAALSEMIKDDSSLKLSQHISKELELWALGLLYRQELNNVMTK